jgi:hypothetical protein
MNFFDTAIDNLLLSLKSLENMSKKYSKSQVESKIY